MNDCVLGIDFGTDSVRALIADQTGNILATAVSYYPRWKQKLYCDPVKDQFRQHPLDYVESLTDAIQQAIASAGDGVGERIKGIGVDTTGSTPVAVDTSGTPLALIPGFEENPHAMFVLWKDHTALAEAERINQYNADWGGEDYLAYVGGIYSSEWFWAKLIRTLKADEQVRQAAASWVEHCDWIPFLLTGGTDVTHMKRSRCAAGHKALWHADFHGLPPQAYFTGIDPVLAGWRDKLFEETFPSDEVVGTISAEWAQKLGINPGAVVAVGAFDAHMGAVGGELPPYYLSRIMGTSTCDIMVAPYEDIGQNTVSGICGQVDGSVIPGMVGLEAGQSAFGDAYAWFRDLVNWPVQEILSEMEYVDDTLKERLASDILDQTIARLSTAAAALPNDPAGVLALDWLNGRRTPDADQRLAGAFLGLKLGTDAPRMFRALVESTCFGARAIVERFEQEGVHIQGMIGLGGVSKKAPFVMQTLANVLNRPIKIAAAEQTCALGAAMFAATAAQIYPSVTEAMNAMGSGFDAEYLPQPTEVALYDILYQRYSELGDFASQAYHALEAQNIQA